MKTITFPAVVLATLLWAGVVQAQAMLAHSQDFDGQSVYGPSLVWPAFGLNSEIADEFDLVANIDRVTATGSAYSHAASFQGVHVRFYEFGADNEPGRAPARNISWLPAIRTCPSTPLAKLAQRCHPHSLPPAGILSPFTRPIIDYWYWWSSSSGAPRGEAFYFRNNAIGEGWHHGDNLNISVNADVMFSLYGTVTNAGVITSLSESTLPRSGYLEIFGSNFGADGSVLIGGINAPVAS